MNLLPVSAYPEKLVNDSLVSVPDNATFWRYFTTTIHIVFFAYFQVNKRDLSNCELPHTHH